MSSTRAGRHHDSSDSSVKKCQEWSSGMPSADCSTLALMSSLSAPASGAPCGTGIIRIADEKNFSSKRSSEEREGAQFLDQEDGAQRDGAGPTQLVRAGQESRLGLWALPTAAMLLSSDAPLSLFHMTSASARHAGRGALPPHCPPPAPGALVLT